MGTGLQGAQSGNDLAVHLRPRPIRHDWYRCQAAVNKGTLANFNACTFSFGVAYNESGNPSLQPENSETFSYAWCFQPTFMPEEFGISQSPLTAGCCIRSASSA